MKTLLIPVDHSESSEQLIHAAISHFPDMPLELVLVHPYSLPSKPTELVRKALTHCLDQKSLVLLNRLKDNIKDRYPVYPSIRVRTYCQFGSAQQVIEDHARAVCPDFIVMAEPRRSGIWSKLNPPLAVRLISRVEVPILTLPLRSLHRAAERLVLATRAIPMHPNSN